MSAAGMTAEDARSVAAAEWLARRVLGDSGRAPDGLDAWLAEDAGNRGALASAEAIWADLDAVVRRPAPAAANVVPFPQRRARPAWLAPAMAAAASIVLALAVMLWLRPDGEAFDTKVGQQRTIVLEDDTRMMLNTDTRVTVSYSREQRLVRLERGEALFEVARDAGRPFLVRAGADEVRAIGTEFMVRRDGAFVAVTLLEGKVGVRRGEGPQTLLVPGDRLTVGASPAGTRDRPRIDSVTAWQRGEMVLYDTPVTEAVREMNRYSNLRIELTPGSAAGAKLTGVYKLGRTVDFARTLSVLYDLRLSVDGNRIVLREQLQKN